MKNQPKLQISTETITPPRAEEYLNTNTHNRPLNNAHVRKLVDQLKRGLWTLNGDSLAWDWNGVLIDGQHRLFACIEADVEFQTVCIRGLDPEAFNTKGTLQRARSSADVLSIAGEKQTLRLAAALQWLTAFRRGEHDKASSSSRLYSIAELQDTLAAHPDIRHFIRVAPSGRWLPQALFAALFYAFSRVDAALVEKMIEGLRAGFEPGTPFNFLRERLRNDADHRKPGETANQTMIAALAVKAWNAEKGGAEMKSLRWLAGETFPKIDNLKLD